MASSAAAPRDRLGSVGPSSDSASNLQFPPTSSRQPSSGHVSSDLAPPWPFNLQDTALIRSGYGPAFKPTDSKDSKDKSKKKPTSKMAEPRARAPRHKGQLNFPTERMFLSFHTSVLMFSND